MNLKLDK